MDTVEQRQEATEYANTLLGDDYQNEPEEGDEPIEAQEEEPEEVEASEEAEEAVEEPEEEGPRFVEVEIAGKKYEVPEEIADGYMKTEDYTRKTQSLAEYRKEAEVVRQQVEFQKAEMDFMTSIQAEVNNLGYLEAKIQELNEGLTKGVGDMSSEQLFRKKIELDGLKDDAKKLRDELNGKYNNFQQAQQQSLKELLNKSTEIVKSTVPDWNDKKQKQLYDYALAEGFTQEEASSIVDPRHVRVLWKAAEYDRLQSQGGKAAEKAMKAVKPKSRDPMPKDTRRKLDLKNKLKSRNLSQKDKANLIGENVADWFFNAKG